MPATASTTGTRLGRPSPAALAQVFKQQTGLDFKPPPSQVYENKTSSPVHAVPEFADMGGVAIAYPGTVARLSAHIQLPPSGPRMFGIPDELVIRLQQADSDKPVHVFVFCDDAGELEPLRDRLAKYADAHGLSYDPELIHFVPWDTDTYWTRDYAPWWVQYGETGQFGIAKHIYTTLGGGSVGLVEGAEHVSPREGLGIFRPNDDSAAVKLSDFLNGPIRAWDSAEWHGHKLDPIPPHDWYCTGLLEVGGNFMVTGDGVIASTYLVATQNELPVPRQGAGHSGDPAPEVIDERMRYVLAQLNRFMGVHTYHVLPDPTGTYIGHIDCWGKFLAARKVLIADSEDPATSQKFGEIADSFTAQGFEVYRVMCQDVYIPGADTPATTAAYTNSLILNDRVYVPVAGPAHKDRDEAALAVYGKALPGYQVIGIPSKPEAPWLGTDALHCRTHGIPRQVITNWLNSQLRA